MPSYFGCVSALIGVLCATDAFIHLNSLERNYSSQLITRVSQGLICPSSSTYLKLSELKELRVNPQDFCFPGSNIVDKHAVDMGIAEYNDTLETRRKRRAFNALLQNREEKEQDIDIVFQKPVSIHYTE
jgi:hypothetical protein